MPLPLLMGELQPVEQVALAGLVQHPGYAVFEKILMAACKRATDETISLNPTEKGYLQRLAALQSRARERNEFSLLVLQSIAYYTRPPEEPGKPEQNRILRGMKQ